MYQSLLVNTENLICTITINRPDKLNALNRTVIEELSQAVDEALADSATGAVVITGAGTKAFVAGADISEFLALDASGGAALAQKGQDMVFSKIEHASKPFVAAINGFALGGGCELAMACHLRVAAEQARFGQPEVNLGLIPGYGGTQRLTQLVGKSKALELMMTGNMIDAGEAKQLGLVNQVTTAEDLLPATYKLLEPILAKGPQAISKVIAAVNAYYAADKDGFAEEIRLFGECFGTAEMKEGVTAFLEKRKAAFRS